MSTERKSKDESKLTRKWKGIADDIGVDVKTAKKFAARAIRPLPVRQDHLGVYLDHAARDEWLDGEDRSYQDVLAKTGPELRAAS